MNAPVPLNLSFDVSALREAVAAQQGIDCLPLRASPDQWVTLSNYMQPCTLIDGQVLMQRASHDRSLYFVESGALSVHFEDTKKRLRVATVGPGSVVGEGAFFSHLPRTATVQASGPCKLWGLAPMRYTELANRHPGLALALVHALGAVLAKRYANKAKRTAIT